jgi:mRNA-degrading endonuclease YafQ of YafQ-DinJ toxin-antitoxin module
MWRYALLSLLLSFSARVYPENLYLAQMKQAQWSEEELQETLEKLADYKPIEIAELLKLAPFHHRVDSDPKPVGDFCIDCHTHLPHRKSEWLRSYLNMHVNYLACTSCHYQPDGVRLTYRWSRQNGEQGQGTPRKLISPFYRQDLVTPTTRQAEIAEVLDTWDDADINTKAQQHLRLHTPLQSDGTGCKDCHTTQTPLLDYQMLGYDAEEIKSITENRIARFLAEESFKDKPIKLMDLLQ